MMTDEEIGILIENLKPDLTKAIRGMMNGELVHIFDFGKSRNTRESITLFMCREAPAAVLEKTCDGLKKWNEIALRITRQ